MEISYSISQRKKKQGIMTWYLRTSCGGRATYRSLKTTSKKMAQSRLDELNAKRFAPNISGNGDASMQDIISSWTRHIEFKNGKESKTAMAYKSRISHFKYFCEQNKINLYSSLTPMDLEKFVQGIGSKQPKTIKEIINVAKLCIAWAIENYDLPERDKFKTVKPPKIKQTRFEFWNSEEIDSILKNAPSNEYRAFWGLMAYAGLRFSEARTLKRCNVHDKVITIIQGKGGKDDEVPLSSKLKSLLDGVESDGGDLVIPKDSVPMRSDKAVVELKISVRAAGLECNEVSHHKLRHSFASELMRKRVNPEAVKELMRHSGSMDVLFRHYAHVKRDDLYAAVETL